MADSDADQQGQGVSIVTLPVQLATIPVFLRPGTIIARKMRLRRSSKLMFHDPYTLFIAPHAQAASGSVYMDDESSFSYEQGLFAHRQLRYSQHRIECRKLKDVVRPIGYADSFIQQESFSLDNRVERLVLANQIQAPSKVVLYFGQQPEVRELSFSFDLEKRLLTIKKPDVPLAQDWTIELVY